MIIYGSKATSISSEISTDKCPSCDTAKSVQITIFQKYAHIFWIPTFPIGKTGVSVCSHCKQVLEKKEFTRSLNDNYETLKIKSKTPIWTFAGLMVIATLIIAITINGQQNDEENRKLIASPQKGDIYEIKLDYKQYTLYKVNDIRGDTVFILMNQFETNKISGLTELKDKGESNFIQEPIPMLKSELTAMLERGDIMDIER